ncbi:MAG: hypothetical protein FWF72_05045 [Paludibacter sp.]|nr:hypothetical protein [Paludibacter sp.]
MTEDLKQYIDRYQSLFWYVPKDKLHDISSAFLVETILNYGTLDEVKELFALMRTQNIAQAFREIINIGERRKNNYNELSLNYFTEYFKRNA